MNPHDRIDRILIKISKLWHMFPEQRLFQLLFNYTQLGSRTDTLGTIRDPFHYQDDDVEEQLKTVLDILKEEKNENSNT